jgi:CBS domain-containing protein
MSEVPVSAAERDRVTDVMLREPKTVPWDATVAEVRDILANPSLELLLLAEGKTFRGAIAEIPEDAAPDSLARDFAEPTAETISPTESAAVAFEVTARNPRRRVVVVDDEGTLLGLVCVDRARTRFCGVVTRRPVGPEGHAV